MAKDRNSFQILLVLCSYQTVFPFAVCVEFLCPSFTQSIFLLFYTSYELVLQLNHRLNWGKSQETQFQRFNCRYRIPFKPYLSPLPFWGSGRLTGRSWVLFVKQETRLYILSLWTGLGTVAGNPLVRRVQDCLPSTLLYTQSARWWRWLPMYICNKNLL